jgi:hypothetical protein
MPTIGVVSSIPCERTFKDALEGTINANTVGGATFNFKYHHDKAPGSDLDKAVLDFNTGGADPADFIVTLGGRVAYEAAANHSKLPFVSLVGAIPSKPEKACYGGVSLESYLHNKERADYLIGLGYTATHSISLFYNQNSIIATEETNNWAALVNSGSYPQLVTTPIKAMQNGNNKSDYDATVNDIGSEAVIISADPFFQKTRKDLILALNTYFVPSRGTSYVCYPLYNYENPSLPPVKGHATLLGPKLEEAIKALGQVAMLAIAALDAGRPPVGFLREPLGVPKDL